MTVPKSRVLTTSMSPLLLLRNEVKDITKIQPLALRGEITTWQYDAKNCIRLWYRMIDGQIYSHKLYNAIQAWAKRLLVYSSALGFEEEYPASIQKGRPSVLQGYYWLAKSLRNIRMQQWSDWRIQDFRVERKLDASLLSTHDKKEETLCVLHHNALSGYDYAVRYRCIVDGVEQISKWVGSNSLKRLIDKINRAVKRHRDPEYRKKILDKMRSKQYGSRKIRPGYSKA